MTAVLFIAAAIIWGSSFVVIKLGLRYFPPVLFAAFRWDVAAICLLSYASLSANAWRPVRTDIVPILAGGSLVVCLNGTLLFIGQQFTTSAVAAVIYSLGPLLTAGFAWAMLPDEQLSLADAVGLLLGMLGVGIIAQPAPANLFDAGTIGVGFVLLGVSSFALGSVLVQRADYTLSRIPFTAWSMVVGAILTHGLSVVLGESMAMVQWTPTGIGSVLFLGVVVGAIVYVLYFMLLERIGSVQSNLLTYVIPVVAALTGWAVLGEEITFPTLIGFITIFAGFVLIKRAAIMDKVSQRRTTPS